MLLLYRIHAILSSIYGIDYFSEYDGLHKYQTYGTFRTSRTFQTFQTTQMPGFSAVVPIFPRRKVDNRRLYCASEKLQQQKNEGYTLYICISRRSVTNQFSPETGERATKKEYDEPHDRVVIGRNTKHPAACKCA